MRSTLLPLLVDPHDRGPLELEPGEVDGDEILEGTLRSAERAYLVTRGIPRLGATEDAHQDATGETFGFKWERRGSYESAAMLETVLAWILERYGFGGPDELRSWFGNRRLVLDAGCGGGLTTSTWMRPGWSSGAEWVGVDISSAIDVARERLGDAEATHFVQADFNRLPFPESTFDTIFAEGTLHHAPSTKDALASLVAVLEPGGEIMFYVYRRKAALREFADDYVREQIAALSPEEAWDALRPLTLLGKALSELDVEIEVPEDVPLLGIPAGRYDVQRLVYWHMAKLFWNPALSLEENNHVNFDWYHPRYAHRQSSEEVRKWCDELGLEIARFDEQDAGFTVRARLASG